MRSFGIIITLVSILVLFAALTVFSRPTQATKLTGVHPPSGTGSTAPAVGECWNVVRSPNLPSGSGLQGVDIAAANDVWAVGSYGSQTLVEHWNGSAWAVVP